VTPLGPSISQDGGATWRTIDTGYTGETLVTGCCCGQDESGYHFLLHGFGLLVGPLPLLVYGHGLLKTTDGGKTWTGVDDVGFSKLSDTGVFGVAAALDGSSAVLASAGSAGMLNSRDGGSNWVQIDKPQGDDSIHLVFGADSKFLTLTSSGVYSID